MPTPESYALDRSAAETRRLQLQHRLYARHTEHLLRRAGVGPGMRVLDVGCGAGDVTLAAAALVGPTGSVLGVDVDPDVLDEARARAAEAGADNVAFAAASLPDVELGAPVDALVGRLILTHLPDRVGTARRLAQLVRPGGLLSFQDFVVTGRARSEPPLALVERAAAWITQAVRVTGGDLDTGLELPMILREAGLVDPDSETCGVSAGPTDPEALRRGCEHVALTVASVQPLLVRAGIATVEEIDAATLGSRLYDDLVDAGAVLHSPDLVGAWARVPA